MLIKLTTAEDARQIAGWRYDGEYAFYNRREDALEETFENDGSSFSAFDEEGSLVGFFHFGDDGQIPTVEEHVYEDDALDIGLGMRPDLCGKGLGLSFLREGLKFALKRFNVKTFRLSVAAFNERAVKVYGKAGFKTVATVTNSYFNNKFYIMLLKGD